MRALVLVSLFAVGCGSSQKCPETPAPPPETATPPPKSAELKPTQPPPGVFHIEVAKDGGLSIESSPVSNMKELGERARASAKDRPDLLVIVAADRDTPFRLVLDAYETAKASGFQRVTIAEGHARNTAESAPQLRSVPQIVAGDAWKCGVHQHVDELEKKSAFIAIHVGPDGVAQTVDILEDPGASLGDAARACALAQTYKPAVDMKGNPTTGVKKLRVFFQETH